MKKVCYGLAIPGLLVGCIINTHMPAKYGKSHPGVQLHMLITSVRPPPRWHEAFGAKYQDSLPRLVVSIHLHSIHSLSQALISFSGCVAFNALISFIIAESIPIFDDLLSLIGALLGSFLCM